MPPGNLVTNCINAEQTLVASLGCNLLLLVLSYKLMCVYIYIRIVGVVIGYTVY